MQSNQPWLYCISSNLYNVHYAVMTSDKTYGVDSSSRINAFTCPIQYREAAPMLEKAVEMTSSKSCSFYISDRNSVVPISMETPNAVATLMNKFNMYANNPVEWKKNFPKSSEPPSTFLINLVRFIKVDNVRLFFWVPFQNLQLLWQENPRQAETVFWIMAGQWAKSLPISQVVMSIPTPDALLQQLQRNQQQYPLQNAPILSTIRYMCKYQELFADQYSLRSNPPNTTLYTRSNNVTRSSEWNNVIVISVDQDEIGNLYQIELQGWVRTTQDYLTVYLESEQLAQMDQFAPTGTIPSYSYTQEKEDDLGSVTTFQPVPFQLREFVLFIQDGTNYIGTLRYLFTKATNFNSSITEVYTMASSQEVLTIPTQTFERVADMVINPTQLRTASSSSIVIHTVASWVTLCTRPTETLSLVETVEVDQRKQKRSSNIGTPQSILTSVLMREIYASTVTLLNVMPADLLRTLPQKEVFQFVVQMVAITLYNMVSRDVAIIDVITTKDNVINFTRPQNIEERDVENCFYCEQVLYAPLVQILLNKDTDVTCKFLWDDYSKYPPYLSQNTFLMNAYQVWTLILNPIQNSSVNL